VLIQQERKAYHGNSTTANAFRQAGPYVTVEKVKHGHSWLLRHVKDPSVTIVRSERLMKVYHEDNLIKQSVVRPWPTKEGLLQVDRMRGNGRQLQLERTRMRKEVNRAIQEADALKKKQEEEDEFYARQLQNSDLGVPTRQRKKKVKKKNKKHQVDADYVPPATNASTLSESNSPPNYRLRRRRRVDKRGE